MRRSLFVLLLSLAPSSLLLADISQTLAEADALHDRGKYQDAKSLLLGAAERTADAKEKAELYWRAARETLELGDVAEEAKTPKGDVLKIFEEGQALADKAIAADPRNALCYYWKSSNIGRWGQVKGILSSLAQAKPMRELLETAVSLNAELADAYFVLGQLYRELPGRPLSFGDIDAAASFGRRAMALRRQQFQAGTEKDPGFDFAIEAAKTLHKRNRSAAARVADQKKQLPKYNAASTSLDRASLYEASIELANVSDREEAAALVQWVIAEASKLSDPTPSQVKDLQKAKDTLKDW